MALRPGTLVGKYRIERLLGEGGMGAVYVATNLSTEVPVALKMMSDHLRADESAARRFLQEARAVAKLRHPGIVRVYDSDRDASGLWIAMELVEGESLASRLRRSLPTVEELLSYLDQLLDTLAHVHDAGIVHRDLKPDNVFLERLPGGSTQVRVLDFGIAKLTNSSLGTHATRTGYAMGTLHYLSPEQALEAKNVDHRSDIYALGAILYECLSGQLPYKANSLGELVLKMHTEQPRPLAFPTESPQGRLAAIAMDCLARKPEERPESCARLKASLMDSRGASQDYVALAPTLAHGAPATRRSAQPSSSSRKHGVHLLTGALMVVAIGLAAWIVGPLSEGDEKRAIAPAAVESTPLAPLAPPISKAVHQQAQAEDAVRKQEEQTTERAIEDQPPPQAPVAPQPDPAGLTKAFRKQQSKIEKCFKEHTAAVQGMPRMVIEFDLDAQGKVLKANIEPSALGSTPLGECLRKVAWSTRFPEQGAPVSFAIPITASRESSSE